MIMRLADYMADFLVKHGITHQFTVTGGGAMFLNDAFGHKEGLKCIYNHHEQACSVAAEGYARASGKICSVCVTTGPGGTNALTGVIANDKHLSYELAAELGVPFLPYVLQGEGEIGYPCVVKSRFGHGGKQVFWADDKREAERLLKGEGYLLQKPSENRGEDIRMYCLGGDVLAAMRRKNENDFRSNFTLGGSCERIAPPAELVGLCRRFYEALRFDFVGIDFLVEREGYLFNEIEDVVGTRMLYSAGLDAAKRFADYLKSEKCE